MSGRGGWRYPNAHDYFWIRLKRLIIAQIRNQKGGPLGWMTARISEGWGMSWSIRALLECCRDQVKEKGVLTNVWRVELLVLIFKPPPPSQVPLCFKMAHAPYGATTTKCFRLGFASCRSPHKSICSWTPKRPDNLEKTKLTRAIPSGCRL